MILNFSGNQFDAKINTYYSCRYQYTDPIDPDQAMLWRQTKQLEGTFELEKDESVLELSYIKQDFIIGNFFLPMDTTFSETPSGSDTPETIQKKIRERYKIQRLNNNLLRLDLVEIHKEEDPQSISKKAEGDLEIFD